MGIVERFAHDAVDVADVLVAEFAPVAVEQDVPARLVDQLRGDPLHGGHSVRRAVTGFVVAVDLTAAQHLQPCRSGCLCSDAPWIRRDFAEMTALCRTEGERLGLSVVVHEGSFAPLQIPYAAMYCPLNSFSFITDDQVALESPRSCVANLRPGGTLAIEDPTALAAQPMAGARTTTVYKRRRTGRSGAVLVIERMVRLLGEDANVVQAERGHQTRRLRPISELVELFAKAGLGDMRAFGVDADYVLTGRAYSDRTGQRPKRPHSHREWRRKPPARQCERLSAVVGQFAS
jgi:hypothetical protein